MSRVEHSSPARKLTWSAGGWILLLSAVLVVAATVWRVRDMTSGRGHAIGDGKHPETYGFDLGGCTLPRDLLVGSGVPRDGIPVLDFPPLITPQQVDSIARRPREKYLVSSDRVIGIAWNGRARAYPVRVLNWHEVVNDTLAGRPVAVTWSPLCDAAAVFDRRPAGPPWWSGIPPAGPLLFGHSGLLYNSNLLLYDRGSPEPSLWSQLLARAVAGPAVRAGAGPREAGADGRDLPGELQPGLRLDVLPCALVRWDEWRARHPETTVLARDPARAERYKSEPYGAYGGSDILRFPVRPLPAGDLAYKTPCVIIGVRGRWFALPVPELVAHSEAQGIRWSEAGGVPIALHTRPDPPTVWVDDLRGDSGSDLRVLYSYWFAWYATHPDDPGMTR